MSEQTMAVANLDRALVHLEDEQLCGIWPDGSSLRGKHLKQLIHELRAALSASGAGVGWHSMSTAPTDREVWFWVVPKTAEETYVNTSGEPILSQATPHLFRGRRGTWGSLLKATHWQEIHDPEPPRVGVGERQALQMLKAANWQEGCSAIALLQEKLAGVDVPPPPCSETKTP
jgi:hypothetical protein